MLLLPEDKIIITVAQTGGTVYDTPRLYLPLQPDEIAESAYECYNEGAAIIHIHARNREGKNTGSTDVFREIHGKVRAKCNIICQDSTGGGPELTKEEKQECLEAGPEMASLDMGSRVRTIGPYTGTYTGWMPNELESVAAKIKELGIKPSIELFNIADFRDVQSLIDKGLLEKPYWIDVILGMPFRGALPVSPKHLMMYLDILPADAYFSTISIGKYDIRLLTMAIICGGAIRVGMEDTMYYRKGELVKKNAQLVARAVRIARELGKEPATPDEARQIIGLKPVKG